MLARQLMTRELIRVSPGDSVEEAVRLLRRRGVRHLLVMKKGELVGIISDRDVKRALDPLKTPKKLMAIGGLFFLMEPILVEEIMTRDPLTIGPETPVGEAARIMVERRFGALPVVRDGKTVGILTETDLLRHFARLPATAANGLAEKRLRPVHRSVLPGAARPRVPRGPRAGIRR